MNRIAVGEHVLSRMRRHKGQGLSPQLSQVLQLLQARDPVLIQPQMGQTLTALQP